MRNLDGKIIPQEIFKFVGDTKTEGFILIEKNFQDPYTIELSLVDLGIIPCDKGWNCTNYTSLLIPARNSSN